MEIIAVSQLRRGDDLGKAVVASAVRLSLLSKGRSMSKSYAQSHYEVYLEGENEPRIWHANTAINVWR